MLMSSGFLQDEPSGHFGKRFGRVQAPRVSGIRALDRMNRMADVPDHGPYRISRLCHFATRAFREVDLQGCVRRHSVAAWQMKFRRATVRGEGNSPSPNSRPWTGGGLFINRHGMVAGIRREARPSRGRRRMASSSPTLSRFRRMPRQFCKQEDHVRGPVEPHAWMARSPQDTG